jgi:hypothetical protein
MQDLFVSAHYHVHDNHVMHCVYIVKFVHKLHNYQLMPPQ